MTAEIIKTNSSTVQGRLPRLSTWDVPAETIADLKRFLEELALGKVNRGKRLSDAAQLKYINTLKVSLHFFNKPIEQLSEQDIEIFEKALISDQIRTEKTARPYNISTKAGIRKALKIFLRWRLGETKGRQLAGWLDTKDQPKTPDYLKEADVEKLYLACRTAEQRFAVAILFDIGARAEEFINIRFEDVHLPQGGENFAKLTLKDEYSKTKGRTVSLYWRHSAAAAKAYLDERLAEGIQPEEPVFRNTYGALRMFLHRLGTAVLKRRVYPHLFRHSSATHYASKLNRQELCYRYGWRFSSHMPDVYISRAGMQNKELDEKFSQTEITTLREKLAQSQFNEKLKGDRLIEVERRLSVVEEHFVTIAETLSRRPSIIEVERVLLGK